MAKQEKKTDPKMGIEVTRMWYKDNMGCSYSVVKYADPYGLDKAERENAPIYVAMSGEQPILLGEALQELRRYKEAAYIRQKVEDNELRELVDKLDERVGKLENPRKEKRKFLKW